MSRSATPLAGKVALITGAARGIGAGTARALAARGSKLVLTDVDRQALDEVVQGIGEDRAVGVVADVCDLGAMQRAVSQGVDRFGGVDLVVANAGIASYGSVLGVDPAVFRRVIDVNITGAFHTVRAALPSVVERRGYILVVSSLAAFVPVPGLVAYNASKAGVEHLGNALRLEVAHHGVEVGTAHMSWIDTPLVQDAKRDLSGFGQMLDRLPPPLSRTTDVDTCVRAFVAGLEGRKRRVYVPAWVGIIAKARMLLTTRLGERQTRTNVERLLPRLDAQVAALGRSTSARNVTLEQRPEGAVPDEATAHPA